MRTYMREYRDRLRQELYDLLGSKCKLCGSTENLEIHHSDPEVKEFAFAKNWTRSKDKLLKELH
jgi:hypothetical protein